MHEQTTTERAALTLTELDVERVLVTHGEPVLRDGARALAASLARPPWSRSSLY
jgi:molybdenum cofactor biosynthesis enzyme MoaA